MNWHCLNIPETYDLLGTPSGGLTSMVAEERLIKYGPNQLKDGASKTITGMVLTQFKDIMILILLAAAIISGLVGDLTDTIVILGIVLLNALVGFLQEYRAEKAIQALKQMATTHAKVFRNNQLSEIDAPLLVPGDLVQLETGNAIPADIRIIESYNLQIDEAAMTGESFSVEKMTDSLEKDSLPIADQKNMAFKGTFVTHGRGKGLVVSTGMQTELGRIAGLLQETEVQTPLQQRMAAFGRKLSVMVLLLCIVFFTAGWLRGEDVIKMVMTSISMAVAAIPEALPAVITISLALAAKRMIRHHCLIRKLPAVESLGSVTFIGTDKTGTLTKNEMEVEQVFSNNQSFAAADILSFENQFEIDLLLKACYLNNDAWIDEQGEIKGDPTEKALLKFALSSLPNRDQNEWPRVEEISFDSTRKKMTTIHEMEGKIFSFTKGAPDFLLQNCININKDELLREVDKMASQGLRVLAYAYKILDEVPNQRDLEICENQLYFLGFVGLMDPPREEVFEAIKQCKTAGIVTVMITGDHPVTAKNIAGRIGIINSSADLLMTGEEFAKMDEDLLMAKVEKIKVYARVSPDQKLQIIKILQKKGHFVAMTGDGVNDAPSLKRANIGIAMGITGTDVSKEAADMILMDDNFSTIIGAVKEGRRIYDNILKFIKYLMTTNSGELWTLLLGPFMGLPVALLPIHILWINLVSDGFPAIALSFEKAEKDIMSRPPRPMGHHVFAEGRGIQMLWVGILMAGISLGAQAFSIQYNLHWQTIVFNVLCLSQMANVMAIRSEKESLFTIGIFSNKPLLLAVSFTLLLQILVTYVPALQVVFKTESLSLIEFLGVGAVSTLIFIAVEIDKWINRRKNKLPA